MDRLGLPIIAFVGSPEMGFALDLLAMLLAFSALSVARLAYWASCRIWLRVLEVEGGAMESVHANNGQLFYYFGVTVQNLGIPLHEVKVYLWFRNGQGSYQFELTRVEYRNREKAASTTSVFQQGMVAAFSLRSFDLARDSGHTALWFRTLDNAKQQDAQLRVYAEDYLVYKCRLWHRFYWLKSKWNALALFVNWKFNRQVVLPEGGTILKLGSVLPRFNIDSQFRLESFARSTTKEASEG